MNFNIFLSRFGVDPDNFTNKEVFPVVGENGNVYPIEQRTDIRTCPNCGRNNNHIYGYYYEKINVSISDNQTDTLLIKRVRFKCKHCNISFSPKLKGIQPYSKISDYTKSNIILDFFKKITFHDIATRYSVSDGYIIQLFDKEIPTVPRGELDKVFCIDEFHFTKLIDQKYCCCLIDFTNRKLIDIIKNRKKEYLNDYFDKFSERELEKVVYFVSDMYDEYGIIRKKYFPHAIHVIDLFHIIKQMTEAVNIIRTIAMKKQKIGSLEYNFMKKEWRQFLCNKNKIANKTYTYKKTNETFSYFDLVFKCIKADNDLNNAYNILQDLYKYGEKKTINDVRPFIDFIIERLKNSENEILIKVGNTYKKWYEEILNAFLPEVRNQGITNAVAENMNSHINTLIKISYGFTNFERFRKRCLLLYKYNYERKKGD